MFFSAIITSLPEQAQRFVLKSFVGTLNMSILGYLQQHVRREDPNAATAADQPRNPEDDVIPTIDDFNDMLARMSEQVADERFREDAGLPPTITPMQVAEALITMREAIAAKLEQGARSPRDLGLPLIETLKFRVNQAPRIDEQEIARLAAAFNRPVAAFREAKLRNYNDERTQLMKYSAKMIEAYTAVRDNLGELEFEQCDDSLGRLPPHVQYKLMCALIDKLHKADGIEMQALLRFNRLESGSNMKLIEASVEATMAWISSFTQVYAYELAEYIERGGQLKTLEELAKARELEQAEA